MFCVDLIVNNFLLYYLLVKAARPHEGFPIKKQSILLKSIAFLTGVSIMCCKERLD